MLSVFLPELLVTEADRSDADRDPSGSVAVDVKVQLERPSLWSVELELRSGQGLERRRFEAETCAIAAEATALVIAVSLNPLEVAQISAIGGAASVSDLEEPETEEPAREGEALAREAEEPVREAEVPVREVEAPVREAAVMRSSRGEAPGSGAFSSTGDLPRLGLALLGGGGYGPLGQGSGVAVMRAALIGSHWRWGVGVQWLPPLTAGFEDGVRLRAAGWTGGTRACGVPARGAFEFPMCAGIEAGQVFVEGLAGVPNRRRQSQPWVAIEFGPGLRWAPLERLALGLEVDLAVPLLRAGFSINNQPVTRYAPVGVRALLGVELRLF